MIPDQAGAGHLSCMDGVPGQAMIIETPRRRGIPMQRIRAPLARIKRSGYGLCSTSGEVMAPGRLGTDPADYFVSPAPREEQR